MTDFTALYEQLKRPLWGLGYLIAADVQDAEDALQDAFLALLEADTPDANAALGALARAAVRARRQRPDPPCTRVPAPVETQHLAAVDAAVAATLERPAAIPFLRAARWDALRPVVDAVGVPVLANGDLYTWDDIDDVRTRAGCAGFLLARPALLNCSIFRGRERGLLSLRPVWMMTAPSWRSVPG